MTSNVVIVVDIRYMCNTVLKRKNNGNVDKNNNNK